jgi:hypothetical protein
MVPVAMFIDDISIWLAYYIWSLCPTAGGQESSTRYIKISPDSVISPEILGIPPEQIREWHKFINQAFENYGAALNFWEAIAKKSPEVTKIPTSLLAENSPYFLTGAKLTFNPNEQLEVAGLILNGWQRIQRLQGNSLPSFGTQINFTPKENITFNWSTFIGTDDPDTTRRMRYFNNFYGQFKLSEKLSLIAGFDIGAQQRFKRSSLYDLWFSPVIIGQFAIKKNWKIAIRAEYYRNKVKEGNKNENNVVIVSKEIIISILEN